MLQVGHLSDAREVKGDNPDKKGYPGPPGWRLLVRLTTPPRKKNIVTKPQKGSHGPPRAVEPMIMNMGMGGGGGPNDINKPLH